MSDPQLDAMLADHRVLSFEEAMAVAKALDIMEKHAEGVRNHLNHPQAAHCADIVLRAIYPVGRILETLIETHMIAPAGYTPGTE